MRSNSILLIAAVVLYGLSRHFGDWPMVFIAALLISHASVVAARINYENYMDGLESKRVHGLYVTGEDV